VKMDITPALHTGIIESYSVRSTVIFFDSSYELSTFE
jgi:hypothetical protein